MKQFAIGVKVGRAKKSIFLCEYWSQRIALKLFGVYACIMYVCCVFGVCMLRCVFRCVFMLGMDIGMPIGMRGLRQEGHQALKAADTSQGPMPCGVKLQPVGVDQTWERAVEIVALSWTCFSFFEGFCIGSATHGSEPGSPGFDPCPVFLQWT